MGYKLNQEIINKSKKADGSYRLLWCQVYRCRETDCTNDGVTSEAKSIYVICPEGNYSTADAHLQREPFFAVQEIAVNGVYRSLVQIEIKGHEVVERKGWSMAGGNYAFGDSRFSRHINPYPVGVHDRYEGK